jgi:hypothetical protein
LYFTRLSHCVSLFVAAAAAPRARPLNQIAPRLSLIESAKCAYAACARFIGSIFYALKSTSNR